jgi:hemoglobin
MRPTLFEHAGGDEAMLRLAATHHARCLADPVLEHPFSHGTHPEHVPRLAAYWGEVLGGPGRTWADQHSSVLSMHAGMGAVDDLGGAFVAAFLGALDDAGLPDDEPFRTAMRGYVEWATAEVMSYDEPGSTVPADLPLPRWGWDGREA